jgi:hypothetical protein
MPLVCIRIDDFDLAVLHIGETIGGITRPREKASGGVGHDPPGRTQRFNVRRRQRRPLHLSKIGADRFHGFVPQSDNSVRRSAVSGRAAE